MDVDRAKQAGTVCADCYTLQWSHVLMDVDSLDSYLALKVAEESFNGATS